jgi:protein-disulfide isomerase
MSPNESRQTRAEQREATRLKAREMREASARKERNRSLFIRLGVIIGLLALVAVIATAIIAGTAKNAAGKGTPANMIYDNGIKIGTNLEAYTTSHTPAPNPNAGVGSNGQVPNIQIYLDYQCPVCNVFETANSDQIRSLVSKGAATVEIHPLSFLDHSSPNAYSSRAENAALCVATYSPNQFFDFNALLYKHQNAENTPGPENPELIQRTNEVKVTNASKIADCINNKDYGKWINDTTATVINPKYTVKGTNITVGGTPVVVVNGQNYTFSTIAELGDPARFAQFFQQASKK